MAEDELDFVTYYIVLIENLETFLQHQYIRKYLIMNIAVISDLHLGCGDETDQFGHKDFEFIKFLKFLESNFEKIILLGDIYECLMPRRFGSAKHALEKCFKSHAGIISRFKNNKYHYVHGNHDIITSKLFKSPSQLQIESNGKKVLFLHGHQYDGLIQNAPIISEIGAFLGGWIIRLGFTPLYKLFSNIDVKYGTSIKFIEDVIKKSAIPNNVDIVITGHTHISGKSEMDSRLYLNSGTCSEGQFSFLSLDTQNNLYSTNNKW